MLKYFLILLSFYGYSQQNFPYGSLSSYFHLDSAAVELSNNGQTIKAEKTAQKRDNLIKSDFSTAKIYVITGTVSRKITSEGSGWYSMVINNDYTNRLIIHRNTPETYVKDVTTHTSDDLIEKLEEIEESETISVSLKIIKNTKKTLFQLPINYTHVTRKGENYILLDIECKFISFKNTQTGS